MKKTSIFMVMFYILSAVSLAFLSGCDCSCDDNQDNCACRSCVEGTKDCICYKDSTGKTTCERCIKESTDNGCDCSCGNDDEEDKTCAPKSQVRS